MFINLSNHDSKMWGANQTKAALAYGEIVDLPFPTVSPYATSEDIDDLVDTYFEKIMKYENPVVMVQGEFTFVYRMVRKLKNEGIKVVSGCSNRKVEEHWDENGVSHKTAIFEFVAFREY